MSDLIDRQAAIDALMEKDKKLRNINWYDKPYAEGECRGIDEVLSIISNLPSIQPEDWMERNKERILQAGMEGREIEFRIGGRLFAIREKAMIDDLISRQAAIDAIDKLLEDPPYRTDRVYWGMALVNAEDAIFELPSAERRKGKWISIPHKLARICSICSHDEPYKFADEETDIYNYCPYCGADMSGRREDE